MKHSLTACVLAALLPLSPLSLSAANRYTSSTMGGDTPIPYHPFLYEHHAQQYQLFHGSTDPGNSKDRAAKHNVGSNPMIATYASRAHKSKTGSVDVLLCGDSVAPLDRRTRSTAPETTHSAPAPQTRARSTGLALPEARPTTPTPESTDYRRTLIIRKF